MSLLLELLAAGPIAWSSWSGRPAGAERPLLVFAGTALDHWSSQLAAELNADREVAGAFSELFVCVAVDVAAEPELAARLQHALQLTAGSTGWPAVALCTPDGAPFGALPWRPLRDLAQRVLSAAETWHAAPADCLADAARLTAAWAAVHAPASGRPLNATLLLDAVEAAAMEAADPLEGGFGPEPRTAEPGLWSFLIARAARPEAPFALVQQVERSLAALCAGAAHDQLGGGFFRGCSDAAWREPLCEKRLTDQAQIAVLLLTAAQRLDKPLWREVALRTLDFTVGTLRLADGTYAHGLHADSATAPGRWEDGACYRWSEEQAAEILGAAGAALIAKRFGLPGVPGVGEPLSAAESAQLPDLVLRLAVARSERPQPRRDGSVYAAEQGQIAYALELAGLHEHLPPLSGSDPWTGCALAARWRRTGVRDEAALTIAATDPTGDIDQPGQLASTAVLAHLRLDLADLTGDTAWRAAATTLIDRARDRLRTAPLACAGLLSVVDRLVD